jgi:hypothetical protein
MLRWQGGWGRAASAQYRRLLVLLQAQASKAKILAVSNAGGDTINAIKQAAEFGLGSDQRVAALLLQFPDTRTLGLEAAQGLTDVRQASAATPMARP